MLDLNFTVESAEAQPHAARRILIFKLRIAETVAAKSPRPSPRSRCAARSASSRLAAATWPKKRKGCSTCSARASGGGKRCAARLWTHASVVVPPFTGDTVIDLPVPCSFDFNVAATKYFHALEDGEVPLCLLFSGTIFYTDQDGYLQVSQIPWEKEASFRLPVPVWKDMMELYYPNCAWLCLERDTFDRLYRYKSSRGLPTWEQAIDTLIDSALEEVES